ncbi:flagellar hook protein FliD [Salibacterium salarium]|uniref:Flagellar hook-associated protein 2 n=1 Tax=Salibacterium salarium TaxID=284579 RepID=A0A3R9WN32_9BACI|nr:flagellar filament capping protein FliD [Salibacterium salarium]RSL29971.1 flagellar hook protein FliD [Salibacterium salarium]
MDNRVTGFASGMDINKRVNELMQAERQPLVKMEQETQSLQYKMDDYREMNREYRSFSDSIFDNMLAGSGLESKQATSSNESVVDVSANSSASEGSYSISNINNLAEAARNQSTNDDGTVAQVENSDGDKLEADKTLRSQLEGSFSWGTNGNEDISSINEVNETLSLSEGATTVGLEHGAVRMSQDDPENIEVNGETFNIVTSEDEFDNREGENVVHLDQEQGSFTFHESFDEDVEFDVGYDYREFSFGVTTYDEDGSAVENDFTFEGSASLNDVIDNMNRSDAGVNAFYDEFSGEFSITRSETGVFNEGGKEMEFSGDFATNVLSLDSTHEDDAKNASFTLNGIETERRSNTFTENGVEMTLKDTMTDGSTVDLSVSSDTETVKDTIMTFVEDYNEMIEKTDEKLSEEFHRDYQPLTDDQRSEMSETEIERWEERSQSGHLRRDDILSGGLDSMRNTMYEGVDTGENAAFSQLTEIGITTTSNYMDRGKLEVDETKLEESIQEDPEAVHQLFAADGETNAEKGLARRVRDSIDGTVEQISNRAGGPSMSSLDQFTIGREMNDLEDEMSSFERRMQQTEERYWDQFNRMEQAMSQANNQARQLQNMMGNGSM